MSKNSLRSVIGVTTVPDETDAPLIVDPDAVLAPPITRERLETVAGRRSQVVERARVVELEELAMPIRST